MAHSRQQRAGNRQSLLNDFASTQSPISTSMRSETSQNEYHKIQPKTNERGMSKSHPATYSAFSNPRLNIFIQNSSSSL